MNVCYGKKHYEYKLKSTVPRSEPCEALSKVTRHGEEYEPSMVTRCVHLWRKDFIQYKILPASYMPYYSSL